MHLRIKDMIAGVLSISQMQLQDQRIVEHRLKLCLEVTKDTGQQVKQTYMKGPVDM